MRAKPLGVLVAVAVLFSSTALMGQSRNGKAPSSSSRRSKTPATTEGQPPPASPPPAPSESTQPGPGTVTPPNQGYVVMPEPAPPGTVAPAAIQSDPLDRAYWEFYDREKSVSLTGKVTRVDWSNPNTYIYLTVDGALWVVESGFIQFRQSSVTPAVHVNETITVLGYFPRAEPGGELPARISPALATYLKTEHLVRAGEVTTAYGQKLVMGQPPTDAEMAQRLKCSPFGC
jgi:Family of unknown function (DUF6152)